MHLMNRAFRASHTDDTALQIMDLMADSDIRVCVTVTTKTTSVDWARQMPWMLRPHRPNRSYVYVNVAITLQTLRTSCRNTCLRLSNCTRTASLIADKPEMTAEPDRVALTTWPSPSCTFDDHTAYIHWGTGPSHCSAAFVDCAYCTGTPCSTGLCILELKLHHPTES